MAQQIWKMQQARKRLGAVVEQAIDEGPQIITSHGVEVAVVLSYEEYRWIFMSQRKLSNQLRQTPPPAVDPRLAGPAGG